MNRRGFLKSAVAVAVASALPVPFVDEKPVLIAADILRAAKLMRESNIEGDYVMFVHPSQYETLKADLARWEMCERIAT